MPACRTSSATPVTKADGRELVGVRFQHTPKNGIPAAMKRVPTVYGYVGDLFAWLCLAGLAATIVLAIAQGAQ